VRTEVFVFLLLQCFLSKAQQTLPPVGSWRDHLPYSNVIDVTAGNEKVYGATPYSIFTVNTRENSIERMSRVTGLNGTGVSAIYYDNANEKLLIAYTNSNIDIIHRNDIINIPDIKRSAVVGNKNIYNIYSLQKNYYFSTGLGIIVVDGERYEIKDSWFIGNNGSQVKVNNLSSDAGFFYAATEEGLKKAALNATNLADYNNWQLISGTSGLTGGACQNVVNVQGKIIVQKNDSLWVLNGINWSLLYHDDWPIINTTSSENKITLSQRKANGESKVTILNNDGSVVNTFIQPGVISFPRNTILFEGDTWIADQMNGLLQFNAPGSFERHIPNSPQSIASGEMTVYNNVFYATAGSSNENWERQNNSNGIYILKEGLWSNINGKQYAQIDSLRDFITIAIDPKDETTWAGSYGDGLLHIKPGPSFEVYKQNVLGFANNDPSSYRVAGLAFDMENNLWISNYGAIQPLVIKKPDGSFIKLSVPFIIPENGLTQVLIDDNNYKWIVAAKGGGLICYDHGSSLENAGDDKWKRYTSGSGNGNLPSDNVLSIAKDKNGFIWVGTTNGIGIIQCPSQTFSAQGCEAIWPVAEYGNFSGYLFKGEEVKSIAIDGADRKWIATKKGVWLVSSTGEKVIYQFTEENSPLLSSDVYKITIDGKTGEVYFATAKGICSFRSTATEGGEKNENVLVFPNPVPPGYTGDIAIRGVVANAIVKITELDGRLVYQTRALGGQAVWDGRDYKGRKISTGVYLVLISNDERNEKMAAKIVFINK
jgi:hypothetical protein